MTIGQVDSEFGSKCGGGGVGGHAKARVGFEVEAFLKAQIWRSTWNVSRVRIPWSVCSTWRAARSVAGSVG